MLPDASSNRTEAVDGRAEVWWKESGDLAADTGCQLAAFARSGDADLQRTIGVGGRKAEGAEVLGVDNIDGYPHPSAQG